jgi:cytochrome b6-f complex iron-sulfur subunit
MNKPQITVINAMPSKDNSLNRRDFLNLVARGSLALGGLFGLGILLRYLGYQGNEVQLTQFDLGSAANFPIGSRTPITEARAIVLHSAEGFTAISLVCPHLGCTINPTEDGFSCPCHGSRFSPDGSLFSGPADRPLSFLRLEETADGRLILHTEGEVILKLLLKMSFNCKI